MGATKDIAGDEPKSDPFAAFKGLMSSHFKPAKDAGEAHHFLTSDQLFRVLEDHAPGTIARGALREVLLRMGYRELFFPEGFVWLLADAA